MGRRHKGERTQMTVRWPEDVNRRVHAHAHAVGLTVNDYVLGLVLRDQAQWANQPEEDRVSIAADALELEHST